MGSVAIASDPTRLAEALFAEKAILGTLLSEPESQPLILSKVDPDNFYEPRHRRIFFAALELRGLNLPIDFVGIDAQVADLPFEMLLDLELHAMPGSIEYWIEMVNAAASRRRAQDLLQSAMNDLGKFDVDLVANFQNMNDEVVRLISPKSGVGNMADGIIETLKNIENRQKLKTTKTGIAALDMYVGGFQLGQLWVVAGRTSMGKSALAQNIALNLAKSEVHVGIVSIEETADQLRQRFLSIDSGIPITRISSGSLYEDEYPQIVNSSAALFELPILYVDKENEWRRIKAKIQLLKFEDPQIQVVFIDHLSLIHNGQYKNRWDAIGAVTSEAKGLAQTLGVAIVFVCQINRQTEQRKNHRPNLGDLRDSGSVEQDADVILLLYRPHYYDKKSDPTLCEVGIAKQRNGPTGGIQIGFDSKQVKFFDR